jgi:hypothetical protein
MKTYHFQKWFISLTKMFHSYWITILYITYFIIQVPWALYDTLHSDTLLTLSVVSPPPPWGGTYVTRYCGHFWPIVQPQMIDEGDCGVIGGMKIGRGNRSTRRKPAPAPFCPPQIPLDQTRARTRAAAVGSQRLTAWAMARPTSLISKCNFQ